MSGHPFLCWGVSAPQYGHTVACLTFHPLKASQVVSSVGLLQIELLWTFVSRSLCEPVFISLRQMPRSAIAGWYHSCLFTFQETTKLFQSGCDILQGPGLQVPVLSLLGDWGLLSFLNTFFLLHIGDEVDHPGYISSTRAPLRVNEVEISKTCYTFPALQHVIEDSGPLLSLFMPQIFVGVFYTKWRHWY